MKVLDLEDAYFHSCKAQRRIPGLFTDQLKIKSLPGYSSLTTLTRDHDHTVPAFFGVIVWTNYLQIHTRTKQKDFTTTLQVEEMAECYAYPDAYRKNWIEGLSLEKESA